MSKKDYTIESLIHNQSLRRFVKGTASEEEINRWDRWIEESEEHRKMVREATAEIVGFEFSDSYIPNIDREWNRLHGDILKTKRLYTYHHKKTPLLRWVYRIAAILIIGGFLGLGFYLNSQVEKPSTHLSKITQKRTISTDTGEQKTIKFSNGSKVILNSNSMITYSIGSSQTINVVVEGEAFFDAQGDLAQKQPVFKVSTPDGVIRDIGTKFLVTVKRDRSRVVLQEGRVEVDTKNQADRSRNISVSAGEMIEFDESAVLVKKVVNSTFYTSWATGSMEFDQTTIQEFAGFVEERFNVRVKVVDPALSDIAIDGGIYFRSLEELVRSVSEVADIPVYQSRDREVVYIGDKNSD